MKNNLNIFTEIIDFNKKYLIFGDKYNISVSQINEIQNIQSSFADLSLCEDILRKEYKLSLNEILTILQIEIENMNEKTLTNQIEYAIFNQKKKN